MGLFRTTESKIEYRVVEVEKPRPLAENLEADATITTLSHHPGFIRLIAKLKLCRSQLETTLKRTRQNDLRDVDFLQTGIFWTEWLEQQVDKHVFAKKAPATQPTSELEARAFDEASKLIELVGEQAWQSQAATPDLGA